MLSNVNKPITRQGCAWPFVKIFPNKKKGVQSGSVVVIDVHSSVQSAMCKLQTHRHDNGWKDGKGWEEGKGREGHRSVSMSRKGANIQPRS